MSQRIDTAASYQFVGRRSFFRNTPSYSLFFQSANRKGDCCLALEAEEMGRKRLRGGGVSPLSPILSPESGLGESSRASSQSALPKLELHDISCSSSKRRSFIGRLASLSWRMSARQGCRPGGLTCELQSLCRMGVYFALGHSSRRH